jgi:hypothetical protein
MRAFLSAFPTGKTLVATFALWFALGMAEAAEDGCPASGEYRFVCGPQNAEDLVLVPGTHWIIASGMAPSLPLYLIDAQQKKWSELYPAGAPGAQQDMTTYGACPGAPAPGSFFSHGLHLRPGADGHSTLYVVGHGGREAIEVFDVDANGAQPVLTWIGCVMLPEGMAANSVASFGDGSLVATVPLYPGRTITEAVAGENTGAVHAWSVGAAEFSVVEGTELPYANGIEVSPDGEEIYVVSSGLATVSAYSNSNPARKLRDSGTLPFIPDNLHMASNGALITAGLVADDPVCGNLKGPVPFDLEVFASCPRPFIVRAIDPGTMGGSDLAQGPANERFSNITMALPVGDELWIGTFAGDRIAYRSSQQD